MHMYKIKEALCCILSVIYGFIFSYISPVILIFAFNFSKGIADNPDGEVVMPIAWLIFALLILGGFWLLKIDLRVFKKKQISLIFILAAFLIMLLIGVILSYTVWQELFRCLSWKMTH